MYNKLNLIMRGVYRLTCDDPNLVYYGSSYDIYKRFQSHKDKYNAWCIDKTRKYCSSFKLYEAGSVEVEIVLECPDDISRREMEEIEQTYIDNDECVNMVSSFRTDEKLKEQVYRQIKKYRQTEKYYEKSEIRREQRRDYDFTIRIFKEFFP